MVAIVSGIRAGLELGSRAVLGQAGLAGNPAEGRNAQGVYVNVATGVLVVQNQDDQLAARGHDHAVVRTYNSAGVLDDDNGDQWRADQLSLRLYGTVNAAGSTVHRVDRDGSVAVYTYDAARNLYQTGEGAGANDTISHVAAEGQFEWRDGSTGATQRFEGSGQYRLLSSRDTSGNALTYAYGASGFLSAVTSASGETTHYDYVGSNLTQVRTVTGATVTTRVRYGYDSSNRLETVRVDLTPADNSIADGKVYLTTYAYDGSSKRVSGITQSDGTSLSIGYVDAGGGNFKVASIRDGLNQVTTFAYGAGFATVTSALNLTTRYDFDGLGQLTRITPPAAGGASGVRQFAYAAGGDVIAVTDGEGRTVNFGYDTRGNQVLQRDHAGNTVKRTFDARNQLLTETVHLQPDPDGAGLAQAAGPQTTRYVHDAGARNLLRFVVSAEGRVTELRYNAFGERVASVVYTAGTYPVAGLAAEAALLESELATWVAVQNLAATQRVDIAYDARGQVRTRTSYASVTAAGEGVADATRSIEQFVYDQAGQLLQTISPSNGTTTHTYDGLGRVLTSTDPLGRTTVTAHDDTGRKTSVTAANGLVTTRVFDLAGRLIAIAEANAAGAALGETRYFYDADHRLRMAQDPTGVRNWTLYDEAGRKSADIDGNGTITEYGYNRADQVTWTITRGNAVPTSSLVDAAGLPLLHLSVAAIRPPLSADDRSTWFEYDAAGRVVRLAEQVGTAARAAVTETRYDGASRVLQVVRYANTVLADGTPGSAAPGVVPAPLASPDDRISRNFYDAEGRLTGSLDAEGYLTVVKYTAAGQLAERIAHANATDPALRTAGTLAQLLPPSSPADVREYTLYNGKGQVVARVDGESYLTEYVYDANGNAAQAVRYATRVSAAIGSSSTVATIRPPASASDRATLRTFDALNRCTQETSPEGVLTQWTYDATGNVVSTVKAATSAEVRSLLARYDLQGRLSGELSAEGAALLTGGQTQAQVDAIWAQHGRTHAYDAAGRRISTTDASGNRTLFFYNADGALTHTVNAALGEVRENRYDVRGRRVDEIRYATRISVAGLLGGLAPASLLSSLAAIANAALDSRTTFTYTRDDKVSSSTDAEGSVTTAAYNAFGDEVNRQRTGTALGLLETFAVDRRGLRTLSTESGTGVNAQTRAEYDAFGRTVRTVLLDGTTREQSYDRLGRIVATRDARNASRTSTYDAFERVLTQTDAMGRTTTYAYDKTARTITVTTPEGIVTTTTRNRHGETQSIRDGKLQLTSYTYDRDGNLLQSTSALSATSTMYDTAGRIKETRDANGNRVIFSYDAANRLLKRQVDPAGLNLTTSYAYDAKGQRVSVTDPNGVVTVTAYDRKGQVLKQTVDPSGLNLQTTYSYDGAGRTLTVTSPGGTTTQYVYDALGRRTQERVDPAGLNLQRSWVYDSRGNVTSSTDGAGNVTRHVYDAADRLVSTIDAAGNVRQIAYDAEARVVRDQFHAVPVVLTGLPLAPTISQVAALIRTDPSDAVEHRVFDKDGRLTNTIDATGAVTRFAYDANGNVTTRTSYAARINLATWVAGTVPAAVADPARDLRQSTVYDSLNRAVYTLDGAGGVVAFTYDANGNVLQRTGYAKPIPAGTAATQAAIATAVGLVADPLRDALQRNTYDAANRLVGSVDGAGSAQKHVHDRNGNLVQTIAYATPVATGGSAASAVPTSSDRVVSYAYDRANRLVFTVDAVNAVTEQVRDANGNTIRSIAYATPIASLPVMTASDALAGVRARLQANAADRSTRYGFDAAGRQAMLVQADGAAVETPYDGAGNVVAKIAYANRIDLAALPASATLANLRALLRPNPAADRSSRYAWDGGGRLAYEVDALNGVTRTRHDGAGRVVETRRHDVTLAATVPITVGGIGAALPDNANDRVERHTYNAAGQRLSTKDALGFTETWTHDALGHRLTFVNKKGVEWKYEYNAGGRLVTETSPEVDLASSTLDASQTSLTASVQSKARVVTRQCFDALGNLTERTEAAGRAEQRVTVYEYDAAGRQVRVVLNAVGVYDAGADDVTSGSLLRKDTAPKALETRTFYDALGNAVANKDVGGGLSQKAYDRVGRVAYEIDALGFVTGYAYDAFGGATSLTRYGGETTLAARAVTQASHAAGKAEVEAVLNGASVIHASDRTMRTFYDALGRATETSQPQVFTYDAGLPQQTGYASARSRNTYNAFGEVVQVSKVRNAAGTLWNVTTTHFDRLGRERSTVDAMGYLTTREFDVHGNVKEQREYATALASGSWNVDAHGAATANADDRTTRRTYDAMNRVLSETRVQVEYSSAPNGVALRGDLSISYGYDALGNRTSVTDPLGQVSWTYYDVLGRVRATATPFSGSTKTLTVFSRDAHGNEVVKLEHATPVTATINDHPVLPVRENDRQTIKRFDALGRATEVRDANGNLSYTSFDAHGRIAKTWRAITDADNATHVQFQVNIYDAVGQLVETRTPASTGMIRGGLTASYAPAVTSPLGMLSPHMVSMEWSTLVDPAGGAVRVEVDYMSPSTLLTEDGFVVGGEPSKLVTVRKDLSASETAGGTKVTWTEDTQRVVYMRVMQLAAGQYVHKWEGSLVNAGGSGVQVLTQAQAGLVHATQEFNAFGEVTRKGTQGGRQEYSEYDNAGRLWRTNSGDGVDKVYLYDLQGNASAEIRSSGSGAMDQDVKAYVSAEAAAADPYARRIDTEYNALGHVISRTDAYRIESQGGVSVQRQFVTGTVVTSAVPSENFDQAMLPEYKWQGMNEVRLTWNSLAALGSGDVVVSIDYVTPIVEGNTGFADGLPQMIVSTGGIAKTYTSSMLIGDQSHTGVTLRWKETALTQDSGGIGRVTRVRVSKKEIAASAPVVIDQAPGYGTHDIHIGAPPDPMASVRLETRRVGASTWTQVPSSALVDFGNSYRYDTKALGIGNFEYRVLVADPTQPERQIGTGTLSVTQPALPAITTPITYGNAGAGVLAWAHQDPAVQQVFRYRLSGSTQAWRTLGVALRPWSMDGVDTTQLAGGTYEFELLWSAPGQGVPSSHATGSFTVVPKVASYWVPQVGTPPVTGLHLYTQSPPRVAWDACNADLAMYWSGSAWISLPIYAVADAWGGMWPGLQFTDVSGLGYGSWNIEVHVLAGERKFGRVTYTRSTSGNSVQVTTPPYSPGYWTQEVPAQYSVSITTPASSPAISTTDGALVAHAPGQGVGSRTVRPVVKHNTDRWGNVVSITDPRSLQWVTTYRFNANNQVVRQAQPAASSLGAPVTEIFHDALGRQVAVRDPNGNLNGQVFDVAGNLVEVRQADTGVMMHTYDALGRRTGTVDGEGHKVFFDYDAMGNLLSVDKGAIPTYMTVGNDVVMKALAPIKDSWTYDQLGQKKVFTNGHGEKLVYLYDLRGNVVETRQPLLQATRSAFDANGRKIGEVDANSVASYWSYDYFGRLTSHTDLGGARYTYTYDYARQLSRQTNTRGQSLQYGYDAAGQVTSLHDAANNKTSTYMYDASGRRVRERVVQQGVTYQDNHLAYDAVGNLRDVSDAKAHLTMEYDRVGNRTFVGSYVDYVGVSGAIEWSSTGRYFLYDSMNRQNIVDALNANGDIGQDQGRVVHYYKNGTRRAEVKWGKLTVTASGADPIVYYNDSSDGTAVHRNDQTFVQKWGWSADIYRYDNANRLQSIVRDGVQVNHRRYDGADRLLYSGFGSLPAGYLAVARTGLTEDEQDGMEPVYNRYDANGRLMHQSVLNSNWTGRTETTWDTADNIGGNSQFIADGYDAIGNAKGYVVRDVKSGALYEYITSFKRFDSHQADVIWGKGTKTAAGTTTHGYDANGMLVSLTDSTKSENNRRFVNDSEGKALYVNQGGRIQRQLIVNGEVQGIYGVGIDERKPKDGSSNPNFANIVDFDFSYAPITRSYPNASPGTYVVRPGDTLQSISQSAYGDSALWYRIAEANGLVMSNDLKVGQTLNVPNRVGTIHNNQSTFKPYDPSRIVGDVSPNLPVPKGDCGGVGQLLMVIVAIVVTIYTAGAIAGALGSVTTGATTAATGVAALAGGTAGSVTISAGLVSGSLASLTGAVVGGAAGSMASQLVGKAVGAIDHFSWKGVALGALATGVTAGIGAGGALAGTSYGSVAGRALLSNVITQGVAVATGLQSRFSWRAVAAAGVGAAVGAAVGDGLAGRLPPDVAGPPTLGVFSEFGTPGDILRAGLTGLTAGMVAGVLRGGRLVTQQVAADAFGNALGHSLAEAMTDSPTRVTGLRKDGVSSQPPSLFDLEEVSLIAGSMQSRPSPTTRFTAAWSGMLTATQTGAPEHATPIQQQQALEVYQESLGAFKEVVEYTGQNPKLRDALISRYQAWTNEGGWLKPPMVQNAGVALGTLLSNPTPESAVALSMAMSGSHGIRTSPEAMGGLLGMLALSKDSDRITANLDSMARSSVEYDGNSYNSFQFGGVKSNAMDVASVLALPVGTGATRAVTLAGRVALAAGTALVNGVNFLAQATLDVITGRAAIMSVALRTAEVGGVPAPVPGVGIYSTLRRAAAIDPTPEPVSPSRPNTTRMGVTRKNDADMRQLRDLWDDLGYGEILSTSNRQLIAKGLRPKVDEAWVKVFREDAGLIGERITPHHIAGLPVTVPLPITRHLNAHMPGGFRYNAGGPGAAVPLYPARPQGANNP